jgi:hypothetical protein
VRVFRAMRSRMVLSLGSFKDVLITTTCDIHPRMFEFYSSKKTDKLYNKGIEDFWVQYWKSGTATITGCYPQAHSIWPSHFPIADNLCLLSSAYTTKQPSNGKMLDPHWIDSNLFRRWRRECDSRHKKDCQMGLASGRLAPARPAWLLDTWRLCLVPGAVNSPYIALSYVWGKQGFFKTLKNNLAQLQNDQAFSDYHNKLGVPRTIEDAISVVGFLEERYLWVDALCIVQDDESTKHGQLNNMTSIFAAATITIVAMQGTDADYGLRGLRGISQPRNLPQDIFRIAKGIQITKYQIDSDAPSLWSHRGWTCQEELFSKRKYNI